GLYVDFALENADKSPRAAPGAAFWFVGLAAASPLSRIPENVSMSGSALYDTFARIPLAFERGEGSCLITTDGTRYLDFAAGIAVNSLGHEHPRLIAAIADQAARRPAERRVGQCAE